MMNSIWVESFSCSNEYIDFYYDPESMQTAEVSGEKIPTCILFFIEINKNKSNTYIWMRLCQHDLSLKLLISFYMHKFKATIGMMHNRKQNKRIGFVF